ncbi:uncharacterized protein MKK02DRAFT_29781 [Dioszegia hungarica]|uniref:Rab-GAP TBC domain-containing protein n=1 Tax=Dioszegia hungarica TaxID=4972 RepID=A0AA38LYB1_9TREE|nr:uncharacterized protein MKK02DRAFT_29781 [Dioszegia hungarica]KAI9639808.1 hypothetical protein MKK02DRAFT_29781 [Dioszegia hungarica]
MSTNLQDYVELLNAEQHVQVDKLRDNARHGITPRVRGEVWMYLLGVLTEDKTNEITTVMALSSSYALLPSSLPSNLSALLLKTALKHHTHRFFNPTYAGLISSITAEQAGEQPSSLGRQSREAAGGRAQDTGYGRAVSSSIAIAGDEAGPSKSPAPPSSTSSSTSIPASSPPIKPSSSSAPGSAFFPTPTQSSSTPSSNPAPSSAPAGGDQQTLRTQYGRFLPPPPVVPPTRHGYLALLEEVLGKFYHAEREDGRDGEYRRRTTGLEGTEREWVWLVTPFMCCLTRPVAVYLGFGKLTGRMRSFPPLSSRLAMVLTLFRMAQPELFSYFEDEQVRYQDIVLSWVQTLFAKEMWLGNVMRLWDAYLAADDMFELHCYVCVAVLATCRETLEELDGGEVKMMLLDLPPLDIDRLLQDAANLRVTYSVPRPVDLSE